MMYNKQRSSFELLVAPTPLPVKASSRRRLRTSVNQLFPHCVALFNSNQIFFFLENSKMSLRGMCVPLKLSFARFSIMSSKHLHKLVVKCHDLHDQIV